MMISQAIYDVMRPMPVFKFEMRMANRAGRKSQTRRVLDPQVGNAYWEKKMNYASIYNPRKELIRFCPYGQAGNYCYMREPLTRGFDNFAYYRDGNDQAFNIITGEPITWRWKKDILTSIFMPKEAARSIYRYESIRVERVQDISRDDAKAEGVSSVWKNPPENAEHYQRVLLNPYVANYSVLWDEINAGRGFGWDLNPWVWVLNYVEVRGD